MRQLVAEADLADRVVVDSAGTGDWHIGELADRRARAALAGRGYPPDGHRARQFEPDWFASHELVIALDRGHLRTLRSWAPTGADREKVHLLRPFAAGPAAAGTNLDVPDPYYGGQAQFAEVLGLVEGACRGLLDQVRAALEAGGHGDLTGVARPDPTG